MNIYSHIIIASDIVASIKPDNLHDYYWGAVIPDIRYLTGSQREKTHLGLNQLVEFSHRYPQCDDFLAGYMVHCLADEFDLVKNVQGIIPFPLIKKRLTPQHYPVILELYHIRHGKPQSISLSATHNPILEELGITSEQTISFGSTVQAYITAPSFPAAIQLSQQLGLVQNNRVEKYLEAARRFQSNPFMMNMLFLGLSIARIDRKITTFILARRLLK